MDISARISGARSCQAFADRQCPTIERHSGTWQPAGCLVMDLPFSPLAADAARIAVAAALVGCEPRDLIDEARLICSELATNALQSGSPPVVLTVDWVTPPQGGLDVEITVTDGGRGQARPPEHRSHAPLPANYAEHGRGLFLVEALAAAWSLDLGANASRAWCLLRTNCDSNQAHATAISGRG
ncbi:hypothetical protein GCM10009575_063120 [Streptomyces rhizosphaericus]|uniref:Histidine kinase/HSP90-like ATPase domain-containing protein n=2 Tax=Streptomyces rhizosphaericus TaxID=114699 RepID=A0ABN1QMN7_9ACTN